MKGGRIPKNFALYKSNSITFYTYILNSAKLNKFTYVIIKKLNKY